MILSPDTTLQSRYHIVRLIAKGGMGAVYEATDQRLGNTVALKQVLVSDPHLRESFEREARLLASLQHPVLPVVSDHFAEDKSEFLVMQYIPGDDLGMIIANEGEVFAPMEVLRWADQLLDALEYLHGHRPSILHRDIKPRNLKLNPRRDIILLDFGLARGSQMIYASDGSHHKRLLTPQYAPLEQIQGTDNDPRSDLYALAATLYHLMTGTSPSDALTRAAAVLSEQTDPLRPANELNPQVPPAVAVILHQAMSHSLDQRFSSATAMRTAMRMAHKSGMTFVSSESAMSSSGQTTVPMTPGGSPSSHNGKEKTAPPEPRPSRTPVSSASWPVLVVSKKEPGYYKTLGEAIQKAQPGTRILVRPGLYREGLVLDKPLEIIGDGPAGDIFIESTESSCIQMKCDYAMVRGLSLRGRAALSRAEYVTVDIVQGRLILEECDISSDSLACVAINGASTNPILWRCRIHDGKNAGILVSEYGEGIIEECDIFSNASAGIEVRQFGNPIIRRCKIHHGERDGIHIVDKGAGIIDRCDIFGNARAGIAIQRGGNPAIRLCTIHDQLNGYGIYIYDKGAGVIEGCDIFGNAKAGIGITQGGNPFVRRCQIHHEQQRGIFVFENGDGTIEKSYILSNADTGVSIGQGCNPYFRNCNINQNGAQGIRVLPHGGGVVEGCNLTGNQQGAWDIATRATIRQYENIE